MRVQLYLALCVVFAILSFMGGIMFVAQHEQAHASINLQYNITSRIEYNFVQLSGVTYGDHMERCNDDCHYAHAMNEIVGNHIGTVLFNAWLMMFFMMSLWFILQKK